MEDKTIIIMILLILLICFAMGAIFGAYMGIQG